MPAWRWPNTGLIVLASRISTGSEIAIGGYVESPDLSIRVPRAAFTGPVPAFGRRIEVGGESYRIAKGVWINAAKAIGGRVRSAAKWAMRHRQAPGTAKVRTGDRPSVTLVSRLDYMDDVTTEFGI